MLTQRQLFLSHVAQTSELPVMLEIDRAQGVFIYDVQGRRYYDMNSGIAVSSLGHCHPQVVRAINEQSQRYLHTTVYGEHIQTPQVTLARLLTKQLDSKLEAVYFLNAGTEATELAMKLAKRHTGRYEIITCSNAYHGSTQGAESLRSDNDYKGAFLPLIPGIRHIQFNNYEDLAKISTSTAGVILELIQGEAGVRLPDVKWLQALAQQCSTFEVLLVADEIQSGFGRTGRLFAYQGFGIVPDVLLIGKAMGGGMPIAGVVSSTAIMSSLSKRPALGHITTFGGHPVCCAAALASLEVLLETDLIAEVAAKEAYIHSKLCPHPIVKEIRSAGLMMAVETTNRKYLKHVVGQALHRGLIVDWFLFDNRSFRLAPPLIISMAELTEACEILWEALDAAQDYYR